MESSILLRLLLTVIFGAILGLETETRAIENKGEKEALESERERLGGVRTYTILALIGGVSGIIFQNGEIILTYITFVALLGLVLAAYIMNVQLNRAFGLTTEVAILVTYLIGFLTTSGLVSLDITLFILIILAFFLSQKRGFGMLINKIKHKEIIDVFAFGLTAAVILPLLPNQTFYIKDVLQFFEFDWQLFGISQTIVDLSIMNPFRVWLIVVVISGINLAGYLLSKAIGAKKGIMLTAMLGGLVSSTSTTFAFAHKSKKETDTESSLLAGASLIANGMSYITVIVLMAIVSLTLLQNIILPLIGFIAASIAVGIVYITTAQDMINPEIHIDYEKFSIGPALKFVSIILIVSFIIQIIQITNNDVLLAIVTSFSGITGLDAPAIAAAELVTQGTLNLQIASLIFLATNAVNFIFKSLIAYKFGNKLFAQKLISGLVLVILCSLLLLVQ